MIPNTTISPAVAHRIKQLADYYRANPAEAFVPSPALKMFMEDESTRILVRAANRVGKSCTAAVKLSKLMVRYPNRRYRAVGVNYKQSIGVMSKLLATYIPVDQLVAGCRYSETNGWSHQLIQLKNGTTCEIRSSDQDALAHAGKSLHGVWCDEPPKPDIYLECLTRVMDTGGFVWITATPIGRPCGWLKDTIEAPDSVWVEHVVEFSHKNCPWYTKEQVDAWLAEAAASPWAYRQKIYGEWEGITMGRTFTGFDEGVVIKHNEDMTEDDYWIGIGIDHGESIGKQVAVICIWTHDTCFVLDEVVSTTHTTPDMDAKAIIEKLNEWGWQLSDVTRIVGDINSAGKAHAGAKVNDLLADALAVHAGHRHRMIHIDTPNKGKGSVEFGEKLINAGFMKGTLRISERCKTLTHALKHYAGDEDLKHSIDALRYIVQPILESWSQVIPVARRLRINGHR